MVISGYVLKNTTNLLDVDLVLNKVNGKLKKIVDKEYGILLGEEIAILCDNIAMNVLTRHDDKPIASVAMEVLDKRIQLAKRLCASTKHNFAVYVNVLPYEGDIYFKVTAPNEALLKAFHVKELKDVSISEAECKDEANTKKQLWETLHSLYKDTQPLSVNMTLTPEYKRENVVFEPVSIRAAKHAEYAITSKLLNQLGGGEQIPAYLLMPYMDTALEMLTTSDSVKYELNEKEMQLGQILLNLEDEKELIFGDTNN